MDAVKFIEGRGGNGSNSEWFPSLKRLRLENLCNLESFGLNRALLSLPSLVELIITGCPRLESMPVLPCVERVEVYSCGGKLVQSLLILSASLRRLKALLIKDCSDLISLPENWSRVLVSLEELVIEDCSSLVSLDDESNAPGSTCLLSLKISKLPKLVYLPRWIRNLTILQFLEINNCECLIYMPDWFWKLTSLRRLEILWCENLRWLPDPLMRWPNGLVSLTTLRIGCSLPEQLQLLPALRHLYIIKCQTMFALPDWLRNFTSLESLGMGFCKNLQCVPHWFPKLAALQILIIRECDKLTPRCQKRTGVDWPNIASIPCIILNGEWIQREAGLSSTLSSSSAAQMTAYKQTYRSLLIS